MYLPSEKSRKRTTGWIGTAAVHLILLWLFIAHHPATNAPQPRQSSLALFDVKPPKPPPPMRPEPKPSPKPKPSLFPVTSGGMRQKPAPATPVARIAAPIRPTTTQLIAAPAALPTSIIDDSGMATATIGGSGKGNGTGTGNGNGNGSRDGHTVQYRRADWIKKPSHADFDRVFPVKAIREKIGGDVVLACDVDERGRAHDCTTLYEAPAGYGFGTAGIKLSPTFVIRPVTKDDAAMDVPVIVRIAFNYAHP
jgi:protein TonB